MEFHIKVAEKIVTTQFTMNGTVFYIYSVIYIALVGFFGEFCVLATVTKSYNRVTDTV